MDIQNRGAAAGEAAADTNHAYLCARQYNYSNYSTKPTLSLPPYGKHVILRLHESELDWLFIQAGVDAWTVAKARIENNQLALVLPFPCDFKSYQWPVRNHDILLQWPEATSAEVYAFGSLLIQSGANCVLHPYQQGTWCYPEVNA